MNNNEEEFRLLTFNTYDRKVEDYRFGADALYESEKVKNTIRSFEHDVWNF